MESGSKKGTKCKCSDINKVYSKKSKDLPGSSAQSEEEMYVS